MVFTSYGVLTWLRRKIIRQLERKIKKIANEEPQDYQFEADISIDEQLIQEEIGKEQAEKLQAALANLSERQREAIYLKYFAGLDYQAICEVMEISYQSVRNLVFNGLQSLRKLVSLIFFMTWRIFFA